ncbi:hypothetical protein BLNAU_2295 [Blattamonas nauphoetae]|uniref:SKP1 component dimerisation domain-containing protein n=1 Tax=Blattamonas nauphoetae TaxID=2049346 RepID=A0ABQ9YGG9_9EUKA|nr:hypothetical protein BLNAU_2295 [Blattamonas nauphoetae]
MITVCHPDGRTSILDLDMLSCFRTIKQIYMLSSNISDQQTIIPLNFSLDCFQAAIRFYQHEKEQIQMSQAISRTDDEWSTSFFSSILLDVPEILDFASYAGADKLSTFLRRQIAKFLKGKTAGTIRSQLGIVNDFTHEDIDSITLENQFFPS